MPCIWQGMVQSERASIVEATLGAAYGLVDLRPFAERRWSLWCALVSRRAATKTRRRAAKGR